jgi:HlyD family secretion protein
MDPDSLEKLRIHRDAKRRPRRALATILLAVVTVTALAVYLAWPRLQDRYRVFKGETNSTSNSPTNPAVALASNLPPAVPVSNGVVLTVSGYIINRERIEISPRFLGLVKWVGVKKGDAVTNGQVVVLLDDEEQKARVREAESRLANARVALAKAELDYERISKLSRQNIETRQNEDDARLRVEATRASIKEAEAQLELVKTYLGWTVIRSPIEGVVLEKLTHAGELVTPQSFGGVRGPSTALLAVADPKDLQVEIELNESDVAKVFLGQPCRVSPEAYPDKSYRGQVAEMAPEANRQKGTLQIKVQIQNPDQFLTPELSAKVDFLESKPALAKP